MTVGTATITAIAPENVVLHESSVLHRPYAQMLHLAREYPVDRLLAVFRENAGLDTRGAKAPGAWEDFGHPDEDPWSAKEYPGREHSSTANLLRGHYAGHFLSMLSFAYRDTQDDALKVKVEDFVSGLAEVQQALAATGRYSHPGFLAAYGEWQFSCLEDFAPYGEIWAPYYTTHKIMAGLLDAYEATGNALALTTVSAMGGWVHSRLSGLTHESRQKMWSLYIAGEFGGMNETLARLARATGERTFVETASYFEQDSVLQSGVARNDVLSGMHANQHIPQLLGYLEEYDATGDAAYLEATRGIWEMIVPGRIYAHGGTGESELWRDANAVAGSIASRNAETCTVYNLVKLARRLFEITGDPRYLEYIERGTLNQIVGSKKNVESEESPEVTYMFPVDPGAVREYDNIGTCCGGTGLENHVSYQQSCGFTSSGELWLTMYTPSTVTWPEAGLRLHVTGGFPLSTRVRIEIADVEDLTSTGTPRTVHLRVPEWVDGAPDLVLNGEAQDSFTVLDGGFLTLTREWRAGDVLELTLPMALRMIPTIDDPLKVHLEVGPSVLVCIDDAATELDVELLGHVDTHRRIVGVDVGEILRTFAETGRIELAGRTWEPVNSGTDSRYHMYLAPSAGTISFAGRDTGVPNRLGPDSRTFLAEVWSRSPQATRGELLTTIGLVAQEFYLHCLLTEDETVQVLRTASVAPLDPGAGHREVVVERMTGEQPVLRLDDHGTGEGPTRWTFIARSAAVSPAPGVTIETSGTRSVTGWYTTRPRLTLRPGPNLEEARLELALDDGDFAEYTAPVDLTQEGRVEVRARITTADGVGHARQVLHIDTEPPRSRAVVKELGAGVEITLHSEDDTSGLDRVQWEGPGTFWATFHESFVRALTDTEQVIEFAGTDKAGNQEPRQRLVLPAKTS